MNGNHASYNTHHGQGDNRRKNVNGHAGRNTNGVIEGYVSRDEEAAFYRPEKLPRKNWWEYIRGYSIFFQYIWPKDSIWLQFIVFVCFALLLLQRVVNVWIPIQIGIVTTTLADENHEGVVFPLTALAILIALRVVQGSSGLLGSLRNLLWIPVGQFSYKALTTAAFEHVHSLSLDFHVTKRTGEVLSALNKGASINQFLEAVTFNVFPMILDLAVAIYYFYVAFDALFATIVAINTFWYLYLTIRMAQTRSDEKRKMTNADREEEAVKNDSIISYETVKYFNAEDYEFQRYRNAIKVYQDAEAKVLWGTHLMVIWQNLVFSSGLCVSLLIGGWQTWYGYRRVGDFLALYAYLTQLQGPLNFFASFYKTTQQAMISGERLLELFKIQPTVVDAPDVEPLEKCNGYIRWNNVHFTYDKRRPALKNLNFECIPGTTTAFVGESGGGKSTLFRLMFRYYDCTDGSIEIDDYDVKDLTIDSVRRFIGVVPQDTMLFNETLMYNLKYANPGVSDDEVFAACRAASIHDRIMSFPDQYNTMVGDRGVRLSGGERQRVAIARTMLKNPKIIMLDEATSALDSQTEQQIQGKLENLSQGRTLLIIA
jgi:ATP-binding cassette, subfamily B, vacuolar membrane transporter HMT1/ACLQ